jgi:D-glycero-alpha-D-manno-heptose-7-phosphate kinase
MILVRSPLRISLAGGGSDFPDFFENYGGCCLTLSINKYVYVAVHETYNEGYRLAYSKFEEVESIDQIQHPVFRETMLYFDTNPKVEIGSYADVPGSGTGLGSSSAFTASLVKGLSALKGLSLENREVAALAAHIELDRCGDPIGVQDQFASAIGGLQHLEFSKGRRVVSKPLDITASALRNLEDSLVLLYLGYGRQSADVLREQKKNIVEDKESVSNILAIRDLVPLAIKAVETSDLQDLGKVIRKSWELKKKMASGISDGFIEDQIQKAKMHGSFGEKVVGAGGGGFLLSVVDPKKRSEFIQEMSPLRSLEFKLSQSGTEILYKG